MRGRGSSQLDAAIEAMKLLRESELTQAELAREISVSRSTASTVVGKLEEAGMLTVEARQLSEGNRKTKFYRVAPAWMGSSR